MTTTATDRSTGSDAPQLPEQVRTAVGDAFLIANAGSRYGTAEVLAQLLAAVRSQDWEGPAGDYVAGCLIDGHTDAELDTARRRAQHITDPWPTLTRWMVELVDPASGPEDEDRYDREIRQAESEIGQLEHALASTTSPDRAVTGGERLDLDAPAVPPDWLVPGLVARGLVHAVTGDTGAFKSGWREALMAAGLRGKTFLGRDVGAKRFMVIDGENPRSVVLARWKALSVRNENWENVHLTTRERGVQLGETRWNDWLRREVEAFRPDVIFLDTVARVTRVAVLDNDAVTALYADLLAPLVDRYGLAVVFMHHERKGGGSGDRSQAALGARQWVGQADAQITLAPTSRYEEEPDSGGGTATRRRFAMRVPKHRHPTPDRPEHFEVRGRKDPAGALLELGVGLPRATTTAERIIAACDGPLGRGVLAEAVALNPTGQAFRKGLEEAVASGRLVQREDRLYERPVTD